MTKYKQTYNRLMDTRRVLTRCKHKGIYYESHHVVPKSLGGSNNPNNVVLLTAREHFIAHKLLYKHYSKVGGRALYKMALAYRRLSGSTGGKKQPYKQLTGKAYEIIRKVISASMTGAQNPMYGKVNPCKGKSREVTESMRTAYNRAQKYPGQHHFTNRVTGAEEYLSIYELGKKYQLKRNHLIELIDPGKDRHTGGNWYITGTLPFAKPKRLLLETTYTFYNLNTLLPCTCTVGVLIEDNNLRYSEIRNMVYANNNRTAYKSVQGWTLQYTYDKRRDEELLRTKMLFSFLHTPTDILHTGTMPELARLLDVTAGKLKEIILMKRTRKNWRFINENKIRLH